MALLSQQIHRLEELVKEKDATIKKQGVTLKQQGETISRLEDQMRRLSVANDSLDQYGRRLNIRVDNILVVDGESQEAIQASVLAVLQAAGADVKPEDVVRLHRVGRTAPKEIRINGQTRTANAGQVIVRLNNWRARESAHVARNTARDRGNPIRQDLTQRRRELLQRAREHIGELIDQHGPRNPPIYAYANINCEPTIRCANRSRKFVNEDELDEAFGHMQ